MTVLFDIEKEIIDSYKSHAEFWRNHCHFWERVGMWMIVAFSVMAACNALLALFMFGYLTGQVK